MRRFACLLIACSFASASWAAGISTDVKVETYKISGDNGVALMKAMDRSGPRHGFLARAIAQTRYSVGWDLGWTMSGERCRLTTADVTLTINYRYPELAGNAPPALRKKWARFMVGVRKHEETHGRIARQMSEAARKAVRKVANANDPSCRKSKQQVSAIVRDIYANYEARQQRFDAFEHQPGGSVDRLVTMLVRKDRPGLK